MFRYKSTAAHTAYFTLNDQKQLDGFAASFVGEFLVGNFFVEFEAKMPFVILLEW